MDSLRGNDPQALSFYEASAAAPHESAQPFKEAFGALRIVGNACVSSPVDYPESGWFHRIRILIFWIESE
jgi:hypothetical protein